MAYHGFYSKVGPLYRNLEEHRFRVKTPLNLDRLLEDAARLFGVNPPTQAQNKRRLVLGVQQVRDLGLQGSRLIVEVGEGRCVISYRTVHPRRSRPELQRLFNRLRPPKLGLRIILTNKRILYAESFACVSGTFAPVLRKFLRRRHPPRRKAPGCLPTLYKQEFLLPVTEKRVVPCLVTLYHSIRSTPPDLVRLEVRAPSSGPRDVEVRGMRQRVEGLLRHLLASANVPAVRKPLLWTGTRVRTRRHAYDQVQRVLNTIVGSPPNAEIPLTDIVPRLRPSDRGKLADSLRLLQRVGDVILIKHGPRVVALRRLDFSSLSILNA